VEQTTRATTNEEFAPAYRQQIEQKYCKSVCEPALFKGEIIKKSSCSSVQKGCFSKNTFGRISFFLHL
jgi:hypothetical protein